MNEMKAFAMLFGLVDGHVSHIRFVLYSNPVMRYIRTVEFELDKCVVRICDTSPWSQSSGQTRKSRCHKIENRDSGKQPSAPQGPRGPVSSYGYMSCGGSLTCSVLIFGVFADSYNRRSKLITNEKKNL